MRRLPAELRALVDLAIVGLIVTGSPIACSRSTPTAADSVNLDASPISSADRALGFNTSALTKATVISFGLSAGTFVLTTRDGDQLTGDYTGEGGASPKSGFALLELDVKGGSGVFLGASGTLLGEGKGTFNGEGPFSLSLDGQLATTGQRADFHFHAVLKGITRASCVNGRVVLTLEGKSSATRFAGATLVLRHEVTDAVCSS